MKKDNKRLEIVIVIVLAVLCLTGILFAVKSSRNTGNEVLPQEGTQLAGKENTTEPTEEIETTETENENTEEIETTEKVEATESTEEIETTESTEETTEATDIEKGEPFSEKDLAFPVYGYKSYNEYIEAGNNGLVYMNADNANMIVTGELTLDPEDLDDDETNDNDIESTVRGIKLGDSIDKVFELYGQADKYDRCTKQYFAHDGLKDTDQYTYFLKLDSTKDYFYSLTFFTDQYSDVIGLIIEPIPMEYWTDDLT